MGIFGGVHGWGWGGERQKSHPPLPKMCHTYLAMMKLGSYALPKEDPKNDVTHALSSADISTFSPEISKFCYIKKYRYRLNFST